MSQEELRILLKRLGEQEFGDPNPTIGAVVKATGADALTVSKILRAIRSESLDAKVDRAFRPRDKKIEQLEARTGGLEVRTESIEGHLDKSTQNGPSLEPGAETIL
ncbi:MAG: hypothetical protein KF784_12215 [Fimbriimonadaceae bacterium]|nr:hypothetical protein [Fimbriimonadaceae bacterium]